MSKVIPGYLLTNTKVTSKNMQGKSMKKFIPCDKTSEALSVVTKLQFKTSNTLCCVNSDTKCLASVIGNVGNYSDEYTFMKYYYDLVWKKYNQSLWSKFVTEDLYKDIRIDMSHLHTFSIDPFGCKDIDDAMSIECVDNDKYRVYVHIADVASFIPIESELDNIIKSRCSSIYLSKRTGFKSYIMDQINMLPDELATNHYSLLRGQVRRCTTVIFTIDANGVGVVGDYQVCKTSIVNKCAISYDTAEKMIAGRLDKDMERIYALGKIIYKGDDLYDTHKMVEVFMVLANTTVASILVNDRYKINNKCLLRICDEKVNTNVVSAANDIVYLFNQTVKAKYITDEADNTGHTKLNLACYTHFTSPIRRYADILVHRLLFDDCSGLSIDIDNINNTCYRIKKIQNDIQSLGHVYDICDMIKTGDKAQIMKGVVLGVEENKIRLYIEKIKVVIYVRLFHKQLESIYTFNVTNNVMSVTKNSDNMKTVDIVVGEEVDARVIVSIKQNRIKDKFIVQLAKLDVLT